MAYVLNKKDQVNQIQELPMVPMVTRHGAFRAVYGLVLGFFTSTSPNSPYRVFVTDFTSNQEVGPTAVGSESMLQEFSSNEVLQLDIYENRFRTVKDDYKRYFDTDLIPMPSRDTPLGPAYHTLDKLCICKFVMKLKVFKDTLEGRVQHAEVIHLNSRDWTDEPSLQKLAQSIMASKIYNKVSPVWDKAVPLHVQSLILPQIRLLPNQEPSRLHDSMNETQHVLMNTQQGSWSLNSQSQLYGSRMNGLSSDQHSHQPSQTHRAVNARAISDSLRSERLEGSIVPDDHYLDELFSDDDMDLSSQIHSPNDAQPRPRMAQNRAGAAHNQWKPDSNPSFISNSSDQDHTQNSNSLKDRAYADFLVGPSDTLSSNNHSNNYSNGPKEIQKPLSVREIKKAPADDERIYLVKGTCIGTIPEDVSHVCVKGYEVKGHKITTTDPRINPILILLAEVQTDSVSFVKQDDILRIELTPEQFIESLDSPIEIIYTSDITNLYRNLVGRSLTLRIYQQLVPLNFCSGSIPIWRCKNLKLDSNP